MTEDSSGELPCGCSKYDIEWSDTFTHEYGAWFSFVGECPCGTVYKDKYRRSGLYKDEEEEDTLVEKESEGYY